VNLAGQCNKNCVLIYLECLVFRRCYQYNVIKANAGGNISGMVRLQLLKVLYILYIVYDMGKYRQW
jgi:hypothetical protein